jgi:hypothetical protein
MIPETGRRKFNFERLCRPPLEAACSYPHAVKN